MSPNPGRYGYHQRTPTEKNDFYERETPNVLSRLNACLLLLATLATAVLLFDWWSQGIAARGNNLIVIALMAFVAVSCLLPSLVTTIYEMYRPIPAPTYTNNFYTNQGKDNEYRDAIDDSNDASMMWLTRFAIAILLLGILVFPLFMGSTSVPELFGIKPSTPTTSYYGVYR